MNSYPDLEYWVKQRETIRQRKARGEPFPWSIDPIFNENRFCNVRREDDRGTIWIREHIREKFVGHEHLWFMLCIARMINWTETLQLLIGLNTKRYYTWPAAIGNSLLIRWDANHMQEALHQIRVGGGKVWTGAYLIPSGPNKGEPREVHICQNVLKPLWEARATFTRLIDQPRLHIEAMHNLLISFKGFGQFIAYQACVDMRFTPILQNAPDRETWAAAGPGTIRGLNRTHGRPLDFRLTQSQARIEMREIYRVIQVRTGVTMDFSDVPNILCETDKYLRIKAGEGKMRAKYVPGRGS